MFEFHLLSLDRGKLNWEVSSNKMLHRICRTLCCPQETAFYFHSQRFVPSHDVPTPFTDLWVNSVYLRAKSIRGAEEWKDKWLNQKGRGLRWGKFLSFFFFISAIISPALIPSWSTAWASQPGLFHWLHIGLLDTWSFVLIGMQKKTSMCV